MQIAGTSVYQRGKVPNFMLLDVPGNSGLVTGVYTGEDLKTFKEWTSRRTRKERMLTAKARLNVGLRNFAPQNRTYISWHASGVVCQTRDELYRALAGPKISIHGYDEYYKRLIPAKVDLPKAEGHGGLCGSILPHLI
ncbi:hypothetical protein MLD38_030824 [Melastoma candidum]|uniref:Uncharacterized protein n=1 Tax=Melastoma candidum TaxID=119954 RepID=A0ACB9MP16_9MYRT|nr:hypothetical protein MLD38_030824 [Melastoma candidum]